MNLTTTTPALIHALARDKKWALIRVGRTKNTMKKIINITLNDFSLLIAGIIYSPLPGYL